jgi:hypothetical protein
VTVLDVCRVPDGLPNDVDLDLEDPDDPGLRELRAAFGVKGSTFADDLERALREEITPGKLFFWAGWRTRGKGEFGKGRPVALLLHHTAGAATASRDPRNKGNKRGANNGVLRYVSNHPQFGVPCSNFCLDRDGSLYVMCSEWTYHAGLGDFPGTDTWDALGVPANRGNEWLLGVEIVSKGIVDDLTDAQWATLAQLMRACARAARWKGDTSVLRRPQHRDYAGRRKVDLKASNATVTKRLRQHA